jgi:hypothetical protein
MANYKLTKQGVRDLDPLNGKKVKSTNPNILGLCDHRRMKNCCDYNCGHLICPDCGLSWDVSAEM